MAGRCQTCGRGPSPEAGGVTVYRQSPIGQPAVWACKEHRFHEPDKETQQLIDVIEEGWHD